VKRKEEEKRDHKLERAMPLPRRRQQAVRQHSIVPEEGFFRCAGLSLLFGPCVDEQGGSRRMSDSFSFGAMTVSLTRV